MTKNGIMLSVVALVLATIYVVNFTSCFRSKAISIVWQARPGRVSAIPRTPDQPPVYPVSFLFDQAYRLTSLKVVAAADLATNKHPQPLWHLVSDSGSAPAKSIIYGYQIKGMQLAKPRAHPRPLSPNVTYVLQVEAGRLKGQTNFITREAVELGRH